MGPRIFIRGYKIKVGNVQENTSFNGAADFHPRIRLGRGGVMVGLTASMGPRIFIRGYPNPLARPIAAMGFNGAADFHPRIHLFPPPV